MNAIKRKDIKRGQTMYICEAALEYLIAILVNGSYLATITSELGFSDSLTGILSSIASLGCVFQMLSVFIHRKRMKSFVIIMSVVNQLLFMVLYVIPVFEIPGMVKTVLFVVCIFTAYFIYNIAHPKKINWLMSLVDNEFRGVFTANKEIVSLLSGMVFTYTMGTIIDYFNARSEIRTALMLSAIVIFILMMLHTLSMVLTPEPEQPETKQKNIFKAMTEVLGNKNVIHVTVVFVLYYISTYVATPFYGTYLIGEMGLGLKIVSGFSIMSSIVRILVSKFWGKYADRASFGNMIQKCLLVLGFSYLCATFAMPESGVLLFALYYIFHGVALGGINSALINLIYDYVEIEKRADSLAVCQATSGVAGFAATLIVSPLVSFIQKSGNSFWGFNMYAQQVVSAVACMVVMVSFVYVRIVFEKKNNK